MTNFTVWKLFIILWLPLQAEYFSVMFSFICILQESTNGNKYFATFSPKIHMIWNDIHYPKYKIIHQNNESNKRYLLPFYNSLHIHDCK
jgi:hypothetical protein